MSAGITRVNGKAEVGTSRNVTGEKSFFIGGYQPLFVTIQTVSATADMVGSGATLYSTVNSPFEKIIRACETVGTVVGYGKPANAASSSTMVVIFDAGTVNQGDGTGGQAGATTGFGALKTALLGTAIGTVSATTDFAVTTYTGFTGAVLGNNAS
jgi:hypothetical protein